MDQWVDLMRTIAFLTQKGGTGKTTLAASLAVAAAQEGERVIALDLDPQASLARWGERRAAANPLHRVMVEPLERDRLQRLRVILDGLAGAGFTLAVFDTAGADGPSVRLVTEAADLCLLPARPTRLDVEATAATFRTVFLAKRKAAFVLNQCPPTYRSSRAGDAAKGLTALGVLAQPMLATRMDYQDAIAVGLGVTEYASNGRAAAEIRELWRWAGTQLPEGKGMLLPEGKGTQLPEGKRDRQADHRAGRQAAA
jgi:chromosome partitioning protein